MKNNLDKSRKKASQGGIHRNKKMCYTLITILIMVFIFIQSSLPANLSARESGLISGFLARLLKQDPEATSFLIRKCAHFTEYMFLGISLFLTIGEHLASSAILSRPVFLIAWGIGTFYALTDEIHQFFTPGRSCELRDMCIDSAGVLTGILLICLIRKKLRKSSSDVTG